jgi:hypothetical protein
VKRLAENSVRGNKLDNFRLKTLDTGEAEMFFRTPTHIDGKKNKWLTYFAILFTGVFLLPLIPATAQAGETLTLIAEDSFDYTGNLVGKNGGIGFTNAWTYGSGTSDYGLGTPTLTYSGITSSGGFVNGCSVLNGQLCAVTRNIPLQSSGKVFVQMIVNFGAQNNGFGTPNLRFYDEANNFTGGVGSNGGTYGSKISILNTSLSANPDGSSSAGTLNGQGFLILGIDYSLNKTSLWLNPDMGTFNYLSTPAPSAVYLDLAPRIQNLNFVSRFGNMKFDELKIYSVVTTSNPDEDAEVARKEAAVKREAEKRSARAEMIVRFKISEKATLDLFNRAEILGITSGNIDELHTEIFALPEASRADITQILKVARKYEVVGIIASERVKTIYSNSLIEVGLIPEESKYKATLTRVVKGLAQDERSSYALIKEAIDAEIAVKQTRENRMTKILALIASRRSG